MLEACGVSYTDCSKEEGAEKQVMAILSQEEKTEFPVVAPPYLKHKGKIIN